MMKFKLEVIRTSNITGKPHENIFRRTVYFEDFQEAIIDTKVRYGINSEKWESNIDFKKCNAEWNASVNYPKQYAYKIRITLKRLIETDEFWKRMGYESYEEWEHECDIDASVH